MYIKTMADTLICIEITVHLLETYVTIACSKFAYYKQFITGQFY